MKKRLRPSRSAQCSGVTLIELVMVIAITGILAALVVQFVMPVRSYFDTSRRAGLADAADTALRRIGRDLRLALPNSVRINGTGKYVEFLLVRTGGRYRFESAGGVTSTACDDGTGSDPAKDVLSFSADDNCFKTMGNIPNLTQVTNTDYVVVFNLPTGTDKADAYQSSCTTVCNKSPITNAPYTPGSGEDMIRFNSNTFTYESPGRRFFIIEGAVTYGCSGTTLTRYWNYGINPAQAAGAPVGTTAVLATNVNDCSFTYDASLAQGAGLVTMRLVLSALVTGGSSETVNLYHAVHVNNVP